jgi:hypothetical protein
LCYLPACLIHLKLIFQSVEMDSGRGGGQKDRVSILYRGKWGMGWGKRPWSGDHFESVSFSFLGHGKLTEFGGWEYSRVGHLMDRHPYELFHPIPTHKTRNKFHLAVFLFIS